MRRASAAVLLPLLIGGVFLSLHVFADGDCPVPGTRRAVAGDAAVQNHTITVGTCYNPNDYAIGQTSQSAIAYLKTRLTGAAQERGEVSVTMMNGTFACRLSNFIKAGEAAGHNIKIFSGWRSAEAQAQAVSTSRPGYACTNGANCPHPQGRAADLTFNGLTPRTTAACNSNTACRWAHENASRFQLVFPLGGNPLEPWHIEPVERSGVPQSGSCGGTPGPLTQPPPLITAGNPYGNQFGNQYGQQFPPPPQMPFQQMPLTGGQQISSAFAQPSQGAVPSGVSGQLTTTASSPTLTSSVSEQLLTLASGGSQVATTSTNATSVPVVISGATAGTIAYVDGQQPSQQSTTSAGTLPVGQQTFVTPELSAPQAPTTGSNTYDRLVQLYTSLRNILMRILDYLTPFGARSSTQQYYDSSEIEAGLELD